MMIPLNEMSKSTFSKIESERMIFESLVVLILKSKYMDDWPEVLG